MRVIAVLLKSTTWHCEWMLRHCLFRPFFLLVVVSFCSFGALPAETFLELKPDRVQEIAGYLPPQPTGLGRPISDRAYWTDPVTVARCQPTAKSAAKMVNQALPPWSDDAYLIYSKTGQRPVGEKMIRDHHSFLVPLVLAECLENSGKYLPKINEVLQAYCDDPTWTLPAHDGSLENFHKTKYDIDLGASSFAHDLGLSLYLLGDKVDPKVRENVMAALKERIFDPFMEAITKPGSKKCWWLKAQMNWNAVCLAGSVGAALSVIPDVNERAAFVAAGEHYSQNYPHSYSADGYDTEGVGYWGYGFSHYIILRSDLMNATGGKIDLFSDPQSAAMALFGVRCRIGAKAIAPFADCQFGVTPDASLIAYSNDALQLGLDLTHYVDIQPGGDLVHYLMRAIPVANANGTGGIKLDPLRTFFGDVGILVCRPPASGSCHLGVGLKAGGNGAHSHNDIGSYEIAIGDDEPEGDPGGPKAYNSSTFGPKRYSYKILNSFGHPVPVVNGQLQIEAAKAHPKVLSSNLTDTTDTLSIDMTSAYEVSELKKLVRTMTYTRTGSGKIEIVDQFQCDKAVPLEEGLVTHGTWKQLDDSTFEFAIGAAKLKLSVQVPGGFAVKSEEVSELGVQFTRIGLTLNKPDLATEVHMIFTPED